MINRRQVIGTGLAVSALSAGVGLSGRAAAAAAPAIRVNRIVVDTRFDEATRIARHASGPGVELLELPRDMLELWYGQLLPMLTGGSQRSFGGVTTPLGLFMLRTLAADQRMRLVYRAEHSMPANGFVRHAITGTAPTLARVDGAGYLADWTRQSGCAFSQCYSGRRAGRAVLITADGGITRNEDLVSWIIAPARTQWVMA